MGPFGYGIFITALVRPHTSSVHEAEQYNLRSIFPISQAIATTIDVTTKRLMRFFILVIIYLFGAIRVTSRKAPTFL